MQVVVRGMKRRILDEAPGDIVVLAVHLCGTLSLKALISSTRTRSARFWS